VDGLNWSLIIGLIGGVGLPLLGGLVFLVRAENRITSLEASRKEDANWRLHVDAKLDVILRDLNRLLGAQRTGASSCSTASFAKELPGFVAGSWWHLHGLFNEVRNRRLRRQPHDHRQDRVQ
jgi:hypothetical protein